MFKFILTETAVELLFWQKPSFILASKHKA